MPGSALLKSRPAIAVVAFVIGATIAAGVAWATVPSSATGTITACYPTSGTAKGTLRVIDYQAGAHCGTGQAMLRWQSAGMRWSGTWSSTTTYYAGDVVARTGSSYIATRTGTNVAPPNATYWALMAAKGTTGAALCAGYPHANIDWSMPGSTAGDGCNFQSANLAGMSLTGSDLSNANLNGANLSGAGLSNADLTGVTAIDGNFTNATANGANFSDADLGDANFTGTNLAAATFTGANVNSVTWSGTRCPDATFSDSNGSNPESCVGHGGGL